MRQGDLSLHSLDSAADETDLQCFFSKTLGSKYFNPSYICRYRVDDGTMCRHWVRVNRTDSEWVGAVDTDWSEAVFGLIGESGTVADEDLVNRLIVLWDDFRRSRPDDKWYDVNDVKVLRQFIRDHAGDRLFFTWEVR